MKFTSEEKLLDCIRTGVDLYSPSLELYMFLYRGFSRKPTVLTVG